MDKSFYFDQNLLALSRFNAELCSRLSAALSTEGHYKFLESRSEKTVPALLDRSGKAHPLHSMVDPVKEGERLVSTFNDEGYLVFFGLGGGYHIEAALKAGGVGFILIVEFDIDGIAELLASKEYVAVFNDPRVRLMVDPAPESLQEYITETYQPVLYGGIRTVPLRIRTSLDEEKFQCSGSAVKAAIDAVSGDFSVQSFFGKRWFSNIIRNTMYGNFDGPALPPVKNIAVTAAGPSLDTQLPRIAAMRKDFFLIATDTSLPALLNKGVCPDAVISIDCQHISYHHFMEGIPENIPLFLDLSSPPLLATLAARVRFFSGGHPLSRYVSRHWRPLPPLDTSGANVSYAAVALAELLGARRLEIFGADFSYPRGQSYARGTYVYPFFGKGQNRFSPLESQSSALIFRSPSLKKAGSGDSWYYKTNSLSMYRERLMQKLQSGTIDAVFHAGMDGESRVSGRGTASPGTINLFSAGRPSMGPGEFLEKYRTDIASIPLPPDHSGIAAYLEARSVRERQLIATILPSAAALKYHEPDLPTRVLLEKTRDWALSEISRVLAASRRDW